MSDYRAGDHPDEHPHPPGYVHQTQDELDARLLARWVPEAQLREDMSEADWHILLAEARRRRDAMTAYGQKRRADSSTGGVNAADNREWTYPRICVHARDLRSRCRTPAEAVSELSKQTGVKARTIRRAITPLVDSVAVGRRKRLSWKAE